MKTKFYNIDVNGSEKSVRIQAKVKYPTLEMIDEKSPLLKNNVFYVKKGILWDEAIQFNDSFFFAISKKLKNMLEQNKITGWKSFPIKIEGFEHEYYGLIITSIAGPILNLEALNNYETNTTEFDESTWDGSDLFTLKDTLLYACTEKVMNIFNEAGVKSAIIRPL